MYESRCSPQTNKRVQWCKVVHLVVGHAHEGLDQDVAVQQQEGSHELVGAGLAPLPQPLAAAH